MKKQIKKKIVKNISKKSSDGNTIYSRGLKPSLSFLYQIRYYVLIVVMLFLISGLLGYFDMIGMIFPSLSSTINEGIAKSVQEIVDQTIGLNWYQLIGFIMSNNIKTAFFGYVLGFFFGIIPLLVIAFNGYVLGFVAHGAVISPKNPIGIFILWRLFPHGIFELPAIFIGVALGFRVGTYPFYIKEKLRGFLGLGLSFLVFMFLFVILVVIMNMISNPGIIGSKDVSSIESSYSMMFNNPYIISVFSILISLVFIVSILVGLFVISYKDRKIAYENIVATIKTFIFIVVPLLVIAAIIEGILISVVG